MKKHITRVFAIVMAIAMVLSLTACGHEHEWLDANCLTPKTCASCGETEGEALGHEWVEANYQAPKTCSVCAATEGDALVTYFAEHGLDAKLLDKSGEYDFEQTCGTDTTKTTILKVTVEDYKTIASDETHEALDGYEWRVMTIKMHLWDENAWLHGINTWNYLWDDFYVGEESDPNEDTTGLFENGMAYPITWNGVEYADGLLHVAESVGAWEQDEAGANYLDVIVTVSVRVPVGYDGFVFGLEAYGWEFPDGTYLYEVITDNTLLFRLD